MAQSAVFTLLVAVFCDVIHLAEVGSIPLIMKRSILRSIKTHNSLTSKLFKREKEFFMETKRAFLAIFLSMGILLGYQYFFAPTPPPSENVQESGEVAAPAESSEVKTLQSDASSVLSVPAAGQETSYQGKDIPVETSLYSAIISENGGGIKSFMLKNYKESLAPDSDLKQLIVRKPGDSLPLFFSWGVEPAKAGMPVFAADKERVATGTANGSLIMSAKLPSGIEVTRALTFSDQDYRIEMTVDVHNTTPSPLQGAPYLNLTNRPFSPANGGRSSYLFTGPAAFVDGALQEVKVKDLQEGSKNFIGNVGWTAYEDTYFMCGVIPRKSDKNTVFFAVSDENKVTSVLAGAADIIPPQGHKQYKYTIYFGPKQLETLKAVGENLDRIVNFGWFDVIAKPTLYLLNFLYKYLHNYGVAIILVTIIIKMFFWPIAQKGMKSMKTMQKLQPKMAKLREKYKDDKERLNQEMIKLYQAYKVNPVGGCLPMVLQIPVFFALYKVLLQTIELRHAPFMLWINDLSAPDRLYLGFDLPFLGGLPVLTLLMGASMFLQQKMTPTSADPTQAKVMMFLPVIFTVMFVNFASGLVLYWFVNNLLSIAQQYFINRQVD